MFRIEFHRHVAIDHGTRSPETVPEGVVAVEVEHVDRINLIELDRRDTGFFLQFTQGRFPRFFTFLNFATNGRPGPAHEIIFRPAKLEELSCVPGLSDPDARRSRRPCRNESSWIGQLSVVELSVVKTRTALRSLTTDNGQLTTDKIL